MQSDRIVVRLRESIRLDRYLTSRLAQVSRTRIQRHIERGEVLVDGKAVAANHRLHGGEIITIPGLALRRPEVASRAVPFRVVFEDETLIVVDKPAGLLVHPVGREFRETLLNGLHHHLSCNGSPAPEVGIVHRLDRLTSGLMVLAKGIEARRRLAAQVEHRRMHRAYLGITWGVPHRQRGCIDRPIRRDPRRPTRMQVFERHGHDGEGEGTRSHVSSSGYSNPRLDFRPRHAKTHYVVLRRFGAVALLRLVLDTGRTHQIRVHLQALGTPLLGDPLYGPRGAGTPFVELRRPALHASRLEFHHPFTGERLSFLAPLPDDLQHLLLNLAPTADRRP